MPKIELTYEQVLDAVMQLGPDERRRLEIDLAKRDAVDYPVFTSEDPLWKTVGFGSGDGSPAAREHDKYLYQRDW